MDTSASPLLDAVQETRAAVDEIRLHDQLLAGSWRSHLEALSGTLARLADHKGDWRALRPVRALACVAANELVLATQFEARLTKLPEGQLQTISAELEVSFASARERRAEAVAHLETKTEDLLAEMRAELAVNPGIAPSRMLRYEERFGQDMGAAMRSYAERIEQLLLELGGAAHAAVGAPAGGFLPARESRVPPHLDLGDVTVDDEARPPDELSRVAGRSIEPFRDRLARQVDNAIETLEARIERAGRFQAQGEPAIRRRAEQLAKIAHRMGQLAERLDWMPLG